ncbi:MAG TPA: pyridoxal-dependent decarboxylase [Acidimicrobiales bacterium]|nr:pyridoxal-dependent decarboxylase [Acidimicrobiales bacterium]
MTPDAERLLAEAAARATRYLKGVDQRAVAAGPEALESLSLFDERLPADPSDPFETIALLDEVGSPATTASAGSRYFGFVIGGAHPVAVGSSWIVSAWDQNCALPVMSPVADRLSRVARGWLVEVLGLPSSSEAAFVTGATEANATCLAAARDKLLESMGWNVQSQGLFGAPELPVVVGQLAHSTLAKGLGMVGLGRERVIRVPVDSKGRLRSDSLPDLNGPAIVCVQAGEVNTGSFDPFVEVVAWARERGGWVHVDGAFGLWALASPELSRRLCHGLVDADSWATDAHKWLNVTYDSGVAFVRRGEDLRRSFASVAGYLPPEGGYEAMHHTPQSSQRARQIEIWAVLRTLGRAGVADLVDRCCAHASAIATSLAGAGLEVLNDVALNQVLVRASTDDLTSAWIKAIQEDGTCWCGPTTWQGRTAMRVSVSGWSTTAEDVKLSLEAMVRCAREVGAL